MILVFQRGVANYRLRSYWDFFERFPKHHQAVKFYGPGFAEIENCPDHVLPFREDFSFHDVIREYLGGIDPTAIFVMSSAYLRQVAPTDFTKINSKLFLLWTDAICLVDEDRTGGFTKHTMRPFDAILHNYLYRLPELQAAIPSKRLVHFPCWAAHCYDYEAAPRAKDLPFLVSGVPAGGSREYEYRDIFAKVLRQTTLAHQAQLGPRTSSEEDNSRFRADLLRSRWSPHDGGFNGRMVPRYFESCFAKSVIVSPELSPEMRDNGFAHNVNCMLFARGMDNARVQALLEHCQDRGDWARLANNAYDLVKQRHCTDARIRTFLELAL